MAIRTTHVARAALLALGFSLAASGAAFAASSGGSSGTSSTKACPKGQYWDTAKQTCVTVTGAVDDKTLYEQGRDRAKEGEYEKALALLNAVKDRRNPDVLTMIGYATRKMGDIDAGVGFYRQALALDPDNLNTHEYLGEAYAEKGDLDLARLQLAKVEALCGTECEQYEDLKGAIDGNSMKW